MGSDLWRRALALEFRSPQSQAFLERRLGMLLFKAYLRARRNGRNSYAQVSFEKDLGMNLHRLKEELLSGTYRPSRCEVFIVDSPVKREVIAPAFRDQVVDHLLYAYLMPIFDRQFIYDSYSCREGKGTSFGIGRLEHFIRSGSRNYTRPAWALQLDLSGYFMSIDHRILYGLVAERLTGSGHRGDLFFPLAMYLVRVIVFTDPTVDCVVRSGPSAWAGLPDSKSYFLCAPGCGLPIGKLTSQLFSNVYLDPYDQFVKRVLGIRCYGRYVDDSVYVSADRERLLALIGPATAFLRERLRLRVHPRKIRLTEVRKGIPFLGVMIRPGRRTLSRRARRLMSDSLAEAMACGRDPWVLESRRVSCKGHLRGSRCAPLERLVGATAWN